MPRACASRPLGPRDHFAARNSGMTAAAQEARGLGDGFGQRPGPACLDVGDAGLGQQREGDDRDLPEVDLQQPADAGLGVAAADQRAKADGEAVERAGAHQREHLAGARHVGHQPALGPQAAGVLGQLLPHPDRLVGVVLEQHLDAGGAARAEAVAEGAGQDEIAAQVLAVEQAGVAGKGAVGVDALEVEGGEFELGGSHGRLVAGFAVSVEASHQTVMLCP